MTTRELPRIVTKSCNQNQVCPGVIFGICLESRKTSYIQKERVCTSVTEGIGLLLEWEALLEALPLWAIRPEGYLNLPLIGS